MGLTPNAFCKPMSQDSSPTPQARPRGHVPLLLDSGPLTQALSSDLVMPFNKFIWG